MADTVGVQALVNNKRRLVLKLTNISDGTGETAVVKAAIATYACTGFAINRIIASASMGVDILWGASANVLCWSIPAGGYNDFDMQVFGLTNNSGAGKTGSILLTTVGAVLGSRYTIVLDMTKTGTP